MKPVSAFWRWLSLILLGALLGSGVWLGVKVTQPYESPTQSQKVPDPSEASFSVGLTKKQVNALIDYYLKDYLKNSPVKYGLTVADQANLDGTFKFLGATVKFGLTFDPLVKANGDVELKARSLNVGRLPVPISFVLGYVGRSYNLPKWVHINSKRETVTLALTEMKLANGMHLRANKIDLMADVIDFQVFIAEEEPKS